MVTTFKSLFPLPPQSFLKPDSRSSLHTHFSFFRSLSSNRTVCPSNPPRAISLKNNQIWRISAVSENGLVSEATPVEATQEIVSTNGDGVSTTVSVLLFIAFISLSVLTIGVIYLGVTDFLQKRESEKFEKEETAQKKKSRKKRKVRARAAPRGFGQKIDEDEDDD